MGAQEKLVYIVCICVFLLVLQSPVLLQCIDPWPGHVLEVLETDDQGISKYMWKYHKDECYCKQACLDLYVANGRIVYQRFFEHGDYKLSPLQTINTAITGHLLFNLSGTTASTSWSLRVTDPSLLSSQLESYFAIRQGTSGRELVLTRPLDVEDIYKDSNWVLMSVQLSLECTELPSYKVSFTPILIVKPVSEFPPYFTSATPQFNVSEDAAVGSSVIDLTKSVADDDVRGLGHKSDIKEFTLNPYTGDEVSGDGVFNVTSAGRVRLLQTLDYEHGNRSFYINVTVQDLGGLSTWTVVQIDVENVNDNIPEFIFSDCDPACGETDYKATVDPDYVGEITALKPGPILAVDSDGDRVRYDIIAGSPTNYSKYITVDPMTGILNLIQPVDSYNISHFALVIQARDVSQLRSAPDTTSTSHSTATSLLILVSGRPVSFPAVPSQASSSASLYDEDALFISCIVLAVALLIAVIVIIVMACRLQHARNQIDGRYDAANHYNVSQGGIKMRAVDRGSEKAFMRSLSEGGHSNMGFENHGDEDVFVTDIATYYDMRGILPRTSEDRPSATPQLVPFHDTLAYQEEMSLPSKGSSDASHKKQSLVDQPDDFLDFQIPDTSLQQIDASMLDSHFQALDLLTSVTPLKPTTTQDKLMKDYVKAENGSVETMHSLKDVVVISELEEIVASQSIKPSPKHPRPKLFTDVSGNNMSDPKTSQDIVGEGITSFVSHTGRDSPQIVPLDQAQSFADSAEMGHENKDSKYHDSPQPGNPFAEEIKRISLAKLQEKHGREPAQDNSETTLMDNNLSAVYPMEEWRREANPKQSSVENKNSLLLENNDRIYDENGQLTVYL